MYIKNIGKVPLMTIKDKRTLFSKVTKKKPLKSIKRTVSKRVKNMAKKHGITITFKRDNKRIYKSEAQIKKQIELKKKRKSKKKVKRKMKKRRKKK
tara:strand:+ start:109 stop:396 length:288 start_codon:yes stop_codon:yes gene_type:complete